MVMLALHKTGVYQIRNLVNMKIYVGGAYKDFDHRFRIHVRDLRAGRHNNQHLQNAWKVYGEESFRFAILERCSPAVLTDRETIWIKKMRATDRRYGYNKSPTGGSPLGTKHPPEYGKAVSERNLRMSAETKAKIGAASKGRKHSLESIEKTASKLRGKKRPPEFVEKLRKILTGKKRSGQALINIITGVHSRELTPELRYRMGNGNRGRKHTLEEIAKRSIGIKAAWARRKAAKHGADSPVEEPTSDSQ